MTTIGIRPDPNLTSSTHARDALPPAFESVEGEAAYMAAYDASMQYWPVPYEAMDVTTRFGRTHLVVSGPADAPALVLLHGYAAGLTMWWPNVADLSAEYRVYALDVMGQAGRSVPRRQIATGADAVDWLSGVLDSLGLERVMLAGMSYGGWLTLGFAIARPERVDAIVLLSPASGFVPLDEEFFRRSGQMLSGERAPADAFMRWIAARDLPHDPELRSRYDAIVDQLYLGVRHFRRAYMEAAPAPTAFGDDELRSMRVPTLLLIGAGDPIYDPAAAVERAKRLVPNVEAEVVPNSSHLMSFSKARDVDARVLAFLRDARQSSTRTAATPLGSRAVATF